MLLDNADRFISTVIGLNGALLHPLVGGGVGGGGGWRLLVV